MATNTTNTFTNHTGNGTEVNFSISFSYILTSDIDVTVAGVLKTLGTHYTISGSTVTFTSGNVPANGAAIKFQRDTSISTKAVDFQDGSVLTEQDLDNNTNQVLFAQQEITDKLGGIEEGATADQTNAEIRAAVEAASDSNVFTDADHSKLNAIEAGATADQTVTEIKSLIAGSPLDASHLAANSVDSSELVDGSVDTSHLSADCVTNAKIADDSIDSEHYVDGSIDTQHIANQQITTDKIADSSVTTDKIANASVTTAKIPNTNITTEKIANNAITTNKINASAVTTTKIADDAITLGKIGDNQVRSNHIFTQSVGTNALAVGAVTTGRIADDAVTTGKIADSELKTLAGMQSATASKLADSTALTSDIADLNQLDGMAKQTTITDDDTKFPTSGAVVDYVAAQIAPVGGLEVIANEDSFPTTQPASGVVISISDIEGLIVNGSGVATNARTTGNGSDNVTINGFPSSLQSKTMAAGLGLMVSSTGSSQTYTYHKLLAKEADVEQLSNDINDFAARYRVGSSNPTSDNDAGDLFFNTSTQKLLVFNATSNAFEEAQSVGNFFISTLSPAFNGSTQDFTITNAPSNAQQIILSINGVIQKPNSGTSTPSEGFALDGSTVKLAAAPASGSDYFAIVLGSTVNIGTPSDNTVTTAILQNGSVTTAKIEDNSVSGAKLTSNSVTSDKLVAGAVTSGKLGANAVNTNNIITNAVTVDKIEQLSQNRILGAGSSGGNVSELTASQVRTILNVADGATNSPTISINNESDNRVITATGTANTLNAESGVVINSDGYMGIGITNPDKTGIQNNVKVLQLDGGDGAEIILGNSVSQNTSTNHIGAIAFKNIDTSSGNAPHYAGIRCNVTDTLGNMDLKFYAGAEKFESNTPHMTINSNGIIGVGDNTTSPSSDCLLELRKNSNTAYDVATAVTNPLLTLKNGNSGTNHCCGIAFNGTSNNGEAYITLVGVSSSESALFVGMRNGSQRRVKVAIERTGRLICGTNGSTTNAMGGQVEVHGSIGFNDTGIAIKQESSDTSSRTYMKFADSSNTARGTIGMGSSSVSFNTSSDYRLKENVVAISDGITRLKTLKPSRFNFKTDPSTTVDGFIAHEVTAVPEAVSGTKDEMKAETLYEEGDTIPSDKKIGDPKTYSTTEIEPQQLDYSKLTPLLTAALQEAIAKIETLETKVTALEAA